MAEWRRQRIAAIREPSLKSGVITVGSGFGGTGKTDVAVTLAAIYAAARPSDRVILADSNNNVTDKSARGRDGRGSAAAQAAASIRGFHQACVNGRINVYADLRDAVAWLQGVAVIRGDTADESVGVDFGEHEYLTVLGFFQCMSNIVINDGGTGLFAKLQVGTLLHGDSYVFVTEASRLGFWSIGQVFSRYRTYEGEKERPLTEQEMKHLNTLMDEATVVVDKFVESDPEQVQWLAHIRESLAGTQVSVVATPWISRSPTAWHWILALWQARRSMPSLRWPRWCCAAPTELTAGARAFWRERKKAPATPSGIRPSRRFGSRSYHQLLAQTPQLLSPTPQLLSPTPQLLSPTPQLPSPTPQLPSPTPQLPSPTPQLPSPTPQLPSPTPQLPGPTRQLPSPTPQLPGPIPRTCSSSLANRVGQHEANPGNPGNPDWWPFTPGVRAIPELPESDSTEIEPGLPG